MYDEAIAEHQEAVALSGESSNDLSFLGGAYAAAGETVQATKILQDLEQRSTEGEYVDPFTRHYIHFVLGDLDQAFLWLERGINEHSQMATWLNVWPTYDPLRSDPRFQDLLRRMNFPE